MPDLIAAVQGELASKGAVDYSTMTDADAASAIAAAGTVFQETAVPAAPVLAPQVVTAARILNGTKYAPYDWTQSKPSVDPTNPFNALVTITITENGSPLTQIAVRSQNLTQSLINYQAAVNIANLVARDAAIAALGG